MLVGSEVMVVWLVRLDAASFIRVLEPQCQGSPEPHIPSAKVSRYL